MGTLVLMIIVVGVVMAVATKKDKSNNNWNFTKNDEPNDNREDYPPPKTK